MVEEVVLDSLAPPVPLCLGRPGSHSSPSVFCGMNWISTDGSAVDAEAPYELGLILPRSMEASSHREG